MWAILWGERKILIIHRAPPPHDPLPDPHTPPPVLIFLLCGCSDFVSIPDARRRCHSSKRVQYFYWKEGKKKWKNYRDLVTHMVHEGTRRTLADLSH